MRVRIIRRYSPFAGTWYVVQKKILFWWKDFPLVFDEKYMAKQYIENRFYGSESYDEYVEKTYYIERGKKINKCPVRCNRQNKEGECVYYTNWKECPMS